MVLDVFGMLLGCHEAVLHRESVAEEWLKERQLRVCFANVGVKYGELGASVIMIMIDSHCELICSCFFPLFHCLEVFPSQARLKEQRWNLRNGFDMFRPNHRAPFHTFPSTISGKLTQTAESELQA